MTAKELNTQRIGEINAVLDEIKKASNKFFKDHAELWSDDLGYVLEELNDIKSFICNGV